MKKDLWINKIIKETWTFKDCERNDSIIYKIKGYRKDRMVDATLLAVSIGKGKYEPHNTNVVYCLPDKEYVEEFKRRGIIVTIEILTIENLFLELL